MTAEPWRVGRHVPHHIYRGDGNTVADEVAVTHRPEDAAQIVAEHARVAVLEAEVERLQAALATVSARQNRAELDLSLPSQPLPQWRAVAQALGDIARTALAEAPT